MPTPDHEKAASNRGAFPSGILAFNMPRGACDCHAHIFGPFDRFPLDPRAGGKAKFAPDGAFIARLAETGFERAVIVQPTAYGFDHRALLAALSGKQSRFRGIAVAAHATSDAQLAAYRDAGIRGLRFNALVGTHALCGLDNVPLLADRMRQLGFHAQLYATCDELSEQLPRLLRLDVPIVIDHLARVGPGSREVGDPAFQNLLDMLRDGQVWIKLTAYRNSNNIDFEDIRPFHDALIAANEDRLVWGSDWPFLSRMDNPPDYAALVEKFGDWVSDASIRQKILTTNPARLYGFQDEDLTL